jgi:hypothetical protein
MHVCAHIHIIPFTDTHTVNKFYRYTYCEQGTFYFARAPVRALSIPYAPEKRGAAFALISATEEAAGSR